MSVTETTHGAPGPRGASDYLALVAAGRAAREQADGVHWTEGDLALQIEVLRPEDRPRDPETGKIIEGQVGQIRRYAEDIGVEYDTLKKYRATAEAWPPETRAPSVSWAIHRTLNAQPDRFDLIHERMTVREARAIIRQRNSANTGGRPGWFELLGQAADSLKVADKQIDKFEAAVGDVAVRPELAAKADQYAAKADALAERFRVIASWAEVEDERSAA